MTITSNIFSLIAWDVTIALVSFVVGYGFGRIGFAQLKADVEALKAIVYPQATSTK